MADDSVPSSNRSHAFSGCTGLTSIVIPDSVTKIGNYAFEGCTDLTSIVIPDSVKEIDGSTFENCTDLASIVVSEDNKVYDSRDNCNAIIETESNTLIAGCKNTVIPDSVTEIGEDAFRESTGLTSIVIPNSVTKIGNSAFEGCTGLKSIVIPDSMTEIGSHAFRGCTDLKSIVIPDSVTEIGSGAFLMCTGLTNASVLGPVRLMDITFNNCTALECVTLGIGIKKLIVNDFDEENCAFDDCTALKTINVPAKKADYYKKRLPEELHGLIVELPAEKKAKKK